ncbi:MAG TPA: anaerobic carbon-monoxide dehydrogenase catalytic subunit [Anaerolineales bacterium]|nr:anaerobic carbon-monoxide dehydrogenase catalytic subunit [Anaerolineales bacterium]
MLPSDRSISPDSIEMLALAQKLGVETVWDRYAEQLPQCGFGETGLCCRHCLQGPCRIDPFGHGPKAGICGATADTFVARGLGRAIAAGAAAHSGHAKHLAHTLKKMAAGQAPDYRIADPGKLHAVAERMGLALDGKSDLELAGELAELALEEFSERDEPLDWATRTLTAGRLEKFAGLGLLPYGIDSAVAEVMHRTTNGVDADPVNLLLGAIKCSLGDYAGMYMATDLSDILFGTPMPVVASANLGVLKKEAVNIAVHGHNPVLSDMVVSMAPQLKEQAIAAGASAGINIVGICCTGNEVMMRHGVPQATNSLSQELAILTGALDAVVVDYQCVMPSLPQLAEGYHTRVITTMGMAKMPGATHVPFAEEHAAEGARRILELAIEAFGKRDPAKIHIPQITNPAIAGISVEAVLGVLGKLDGGDPLKPLIDNIVNGNITGVCLFAGCNDVKVQQDRSFVTLVKELARRDVLILATGCASGAFGRHGLLTPAATEQFAGPGLKAVLTALGQAAGLGAPLPLALHTGSCVDNTRAVTIAVALANRLGVDLDQLPVVATAPEAAMEKAVVIGTWAVALGFPTHVGVVPPVTGGPLVVKVLTETARDLLGGYFIVEPDPAAAAEKLFAALNERRKGLGLAEKSFQAAEAVTL